MKFVIVIVSLAFAATAAAVPTNIDAGASALENRAVSLSSTGFQDYVIPAGPTGVDLAGGFQETPGQGNQNTLAQGKQTCASLPNCIAVVSSGGYVSVNTATPDGSGVTGLGDASISWRYGATQGPKCARWVNFFELSGHCKCLPVVQKQDSNSGFGCVSRFFG